MSKIFAVFLLMLVHVHAFGASGDDIILKARFDEESSRLLINDLRSFIKQSNFIDPYEQEFVETIDINLSQYIEDLPADTLAWIKDLQSVLNLKVVESQYNLRIDRLRYSVNDFNTQMIPLEGRNQRLEYVTKSTVQGLNIKADKVSFEVILPKANGEGQIVFTVELHDAEFYVHPDAVAELTLKWATTVQENNILFSLDKIDISQIMEGIVNNPSLIDFRAGNLVMPDVSIRVGKKEVKFDNKKIHKFFTDRSDELKKGLIDLVNMEMSSSFNNIIENGPRKIILPREYQIDSSDISGAFKVESARLYQKDIVQFNLSAFFCDNHQKEENGLCSPLGEVKTRRKVRSDTFLKSMRELNSLLLKKNKNIAISLSEHFFNEVLEATIAAGLWEETLKESDLQLGPEKAFVLAEEKGQMFSLHMDIIQKLTKVETFMTGKSEMRFPVKFKITLNIVNEDDAPHFQIIVKEVAVDRNMVLKGLPEYGLESTVGSVKRFRNKVVDTVLETTSKFKDKKLISIRLEQLKGTYLEKMEFLSDGMGRGAAVCGWR